MHKPVSKIREAKLELYRKKGKIHAKAVDGRFNSLRWTMVWFTQAIFYGACWLSWESNGTQRQAILFDIAHEKLYLFDLVLWPQDALLLALVLIFAATALFFVTALAGRLFCGFACPQTIYTMIFVWIESKVEGDHLARLRLDQGPINGRKLWLKATKHGLWMLIAIWTAITFVGYFTPIRELLPTVFSFETGPWEAFWLLFYAAFTYVQAGLAREAVCQHMCPYSRFQGVMFDPTTANVSYDRLRGEPRTSVGDCIDCGICVQVCPTGIDIRDGLQLACTNCGLCIDACDQVMAKIDAPSGLIRFASEQELAGQGAPQGLKSRPRVVLYAVLLLIFAGFFVLTVSFRSLVLVDVLRDRGALLRETADGRIENAYTLKLMNLDQLPHEYRLSVGGLPGLEIVGQKDFLADPGSIQPLSITVSVLAEGALSGIQPIYFVMQATDNPAIRSEEKSTFAMP